MGPPSYMRSVVDRNVVMRRIIVFELVLNTILDTLHRSVPEIHNSSKAKSASLIMRNGEKEKTNFAGAVRSDIFSPGIVRYSLRPWRRYKNFSVYTIFRNP
jgi:hypothetical protein